MNSCSNRGSWWHPGLLIATTLIAGFAGCPSVDEQIEDAKRAVPGALVAGDREAARLAVAELGHELPETPDRILELTRLLSTAGESPRALWLLEQAVEVHPGATALQLALARVALQLSNPSRAREAAQVVASRPEVSAASLVLLARAELGLGRLDQALAILNETAERFSTEPESWLVRIGTLTSERRHKEAAEVVERALEAFPDRAEGKALHRGLLGTRAQIRFTLGELEEATAEFEALVKSDPTDIVSWSSLVRGLVALKRSDDAVAALEAEMERGTPSTDLHLLLAPLYASGGRDSDAEQSLRAFAEASHGPTGVLPLVVYLSHRDDARGVEEVVRHSIERFPEDPQLHSMLVEALLGQGEIGDAAPAGEVYGRLSGATPSMSEYFKARIEFARGDSQAAAARLQGIVPKLDRSTTQYWLGRALEAEEDIEGAETRYSMALQRDTSWTLPAVAMLRIASLRGRPEAIAASARTRFRTRKTVLAMAPTHSLRG